MKETFYKQWDTVRESHLNAKLCSDNTSYGHVKEKYDLRDDTDVVCERSLQTQFNFSRPITNIQIDDIAISIRFWGYLLDVHEKGMTVSYHRLCVPSATTHRIRDL